MQNWLSWDFDATGGFLNKHGLVGGIHKMSQTGFRVVRVRRQWNKLMAVAEGKTDRIGVEGYGRECP